jgi:CHAT domain-containing protein/Flp pilus assembly protein TadD
LGVAIAILLLSESVAATPKQFSPLLDPPSVSSLKLRLKKGEAKSWGGSSSIAQQPAAIEQDATRAAAYQAFQEGMQLYQQGTAESLQQAITKFEEALPLYRAVKDRRKEAVTLDYIGEIYEVSGEKQKALEFYNQSLLLYRAVGDREKEALTFTSIGFVYLFLEEKQKALDYFNQSLPLYRAVGNRLREARTLNSIGLVYDDLGEKQKALDYFNQSLPLSRAVGNKEREALILINIGVVYDSLGEKQKALDYFNQSLPLSRALSNRFAEARTLTSIGLVYDSLGEKQKALDYFNQSLPLSRALGDRDGEVRTLTSIGLVYDDLGEKQKALDYFNQSLALSRAVGNRKGETVALSNIGVVYDSLGEKQKALDYFNQSLALSRALGNRFGEARTLTSVGNLYNLLGEKQKAFDYYNQSLPLSRAVGDKEGEAVTLYYFAYLERGRGNLNAALTQIEAAINIIENLRTKIASQKLRASYFASVQYYYEFYIDLLMQLHKTNPSKGYDTLALNASERARARNLLEILTEARADIRQGVDPKLVEQERTLQQQLNAQEYRKYQLLQGQRGTKETQQLADIELQIESLLSQLDEVQKQIRVTSPSYAAVTQPGAFTLTLPEIQDKVLDDNTLLLEYSLGEERSYLWAVTKTGLTSYELPKRTDIEAAAQEFYNQLKSQVSSPEVGMKLSQMLLAPVASQLGQKRLLIVSDGALQSIPFAALPIPDGTSPPAPLPQGEGSKVSPSLAPDGVGELGYTPLLVNHEIVSLPSASTIAVLRNELKGRAPAPKTLVAIADPVFSSNDPRFQTSQAQQSNTTTIPTEVKRSAFDMSVTLDRLEFSRKEAQAILALVPENQRSSALDFAASRATATNPDLSQYRIIHLATHGLLNNVHPELSGVVLSLVDRKGTEQDGFLRLNDIFNLNLLAELVVLSACETGLGKDVRGEGLVSLTRGFMYAGSKRVVVSLWSVNDSATAELMTKFYQQMLDKGVNPVAALRAAQLEMWKTQAWKSPYYWAAFVVQGEWR